MGQSGEPDELIDGTAGSHVRDEWQGRQLPI
jgi:hypothetical protein